MPTLQKKAGKRTSVANKYHNAPTPLPSHLLSAAGMWVSALIAYQKALKNEFEWHPSLALKAENLMETIHKSGSNTV